MSREELKQRIADILYDRVGDPISHVTSEEITEDILKEIEKHPSDLAQDPDIKRILRGLEE